MKIGVIVEFIRILNGVYRISEISAIGHNGIGIKIYPKMNANELKDDPVIYFEDPYLLHMGDDRSDPEFDKKRWNLLEKEMERIENILCYWQDNKGDHLDWKV